MVLMNLLSVDGLASVTNVLDLAGVFASALLGGSLARTMDFDLFGFLVVGFVSGLGGGMLRDTLLQNGPPVALVDPLYAPVAIAGALIAFFVSFSELTWDRLFTVLDAAVIGFWSVVGVQRTFDAGLDWPAAIIMGTITAVGGGAMRDLLLRRVPAVFGGNALYATVAVAASAVMVVASHLGSPSIGIIAAIVLSLGLRWGAVRRGWGLPNGRDWQPKSTLGSLLQRGRKLRPDAIRLLRRPGRRSGAGSVHHENESGSGSGSGSSGSGSGFESGPGSGSGSGSGPGPGPGPSNRRTAERAEGLSSVGPRSYNRYRRVSTRHPWSAGAPTRPERAGSERTCGWGLR